MAFTTPTATNTYVASPEATQNMVVDYARNVNKFAIGNYTQAMKVNKVLGLYREMGILERGRVIDPKEYMWPRGTPRPTGWQNQVPFDYKSYQTERYAYEFAVDRDTVDQAPWDILAQEASVYGQLAMTNRTIQAMSLLTTGANWGTHTATATVAGGGKWDVSTVADQFIKKSLDYARLLILKDTLGAVDDTDLVLVVNPTCAADMSASPEIVEYVKSTAGVSLTRLMGTNEFSYKDTKMGLPSELYGIKVMVEKTVRVTSVKGASTTASSFVLGDTSAILLCRPGSLKGEGDSLASNLNTVTCFNYEEMTVESKYDADDRVHKGRLVDEYVYKLTAPTTGFLFTSVIN